jgi:hypothetical protein
MSVTKTVYAVGKIDDATVDVLDPVEEWVNELAIDGVTFPSAAEAEASYNSAKPFWKHGGGYTDHRADKVLKITIIVEQVSDL